MVHSLAPRVAARCSCAPSSRRLVYQLLVASEGGHPFSKEKHQFISYVALSGKFFSAAAPSILAPLLLFAGNKRSANPALIAQVSPLSNIAMQDDDFERRRIQFGLASKEQVRDLASNPRTVFLDVRSPPELQDRTLMSRPYKHVWCTMDDTSRLEAEAANLLPDKSVPIVVFCAIGGRSAKAKAALESMGYENVVNAGGLKDMNHLE